MGLVLTGVVINFNKTLVMLASIATVTVYCIAGTFSCPVCHRGFSDRSNCNRHIRNQHGNVQTVDCNICGATLKNIESLKDHKRNKHSDSAYLK